MLETTNLKLGINEPDDKANWFTPTNENMRKIDEFAGDTFDYQTTNEADKKDIRANITSLINSSTVSAKEISELIVDVQQLEQREIVQDNNIDRVHHEAAVLRQDVDGIIDTDIPQINRNFQILSTTISATVKRVDVLENELNGQKEIVDNLQDDVNGYSQAISDANEAATDAKGAGETVEYSEAVTSLTVDITSLNYPSTATLLVDLYAPPNVNGKITNITTTELDGNYTSVTADVDFTTPPESGADVTLLIRRI